MNEYANGKIYKVTSPDYPEGIYVGSTMPWFIFLCERNWCVSEILGCKLFLSSVWCVGQPGGQNCKRQLRL